MTNIQRRLARLEAASVQRDTPAWPEVDAALTRQTARIRLVVGERLGTAADHLAMIAARETLGEDTHEREAADLEMIQRWRRVHRIPEPPGDVRQRLMEKIDAIASRIRAPMPPGERRDLISHDRCESCNYPMTVAHRSVTS